jgi:ribosome-associated toxin RatA of RatAB toxin-antitoxin module
VTTIEKSVDVRVPVSTAYNQWTQFESFPKFMEGVERITQVTDTRTHWVTKIGGATREFDAEITEQHPEERIAWHTVDGPSQAGVVTFHRLDDETTRVDLRMEYQPESLTEKAGAALGVVSHRVQDDLERFKEFIEHQGAETGAWRGHVDRPPQRGERTPGDPGRHPEAPLASQAGDRGGLQTGAQTGDSAVAGGPHSGGLSSGGPSGGLSSGGLSSGGARSGGADDPAGGTPGGTSAGTGAAPVLGGATGGDVGAMPGPGHTRGTGGTGIDGAGEPDLADRGGTSERSVPPRGGGSGGGMGNLSEYPEANEPGPLPE